MDMEKSEYIARLIYHHIVGDLSAEAQKELDEWLGENAQNRKVYERLLNTDYLKRECNRRETINPQRAMEAMEARIRVVSTDDTTVRPHHARTIALTMFSTAAMLLLLFGAYLYINKVGNHAGQTQMAQSASSTKITHGSTQAILTTDQGDTLYLNADARSNARQLAKVEGSDDIHVKSLATPRGGEFEIVLEDGTEVWLNAESRLKYPETFGDGDRHVSVEGEAYFKVARDAQHPFYVETAGQQVRVVGTEFNVNSYPEASNVTTTLVKGSIALKPAKGNGAELMLTPGHQASFDKQTQAATVKTVDTDIITSWRSGKFVFENQTLEQIMQTLGRWYDFDYQFLDKSLAKTEFMGSVPRYGEFSEVLQILEASGGIKFRQKGRKIIIARK